jgi:hypothetical protein
MNDTAEDWVSLKENLAAELVSTSKHEYLGGCRAKLADDRLAVGAILGRDHNRAILKAPIFLIEEKATTALDGDRAFRNIACGL